MPGLFESLVNDDLNINTASDADDFSLGNFSERVASYRAKVVNEYERYGSDLSESISKIAEEENLNDEQIKRVVEEVNNHVYLMKYAKLKQSPEREVVFDLASLERVKSGDFEYGEEKTASTKKEYRDDLDFLNFSSYEMSSLNPDIRIDEEKIASNRMARELNILEDEFDSALNKIASNVYSVSEALIKYDSMSLDVQDIFSKMCKGASLSKNDQLIYKTAVNKRIEELSEINKVASGYSLNLDLVDVDETNPFSLGHRSFLKEAEFKNELPPIVTDNKAIIRNVKNLISLAEGVKEDKQKIIDLDKKKSELQKALK